MTQAPSGGLYLGTSNLGKIFELGGTSANDGNYESDVFDAKIFSRWGRTAIRGTGAFDVYARSGNVDNPDRNWSAWSKVDLAKDAPVGCSACAISAVEGSVASVDSGAERR